METNYIETDGTVSTSTMLSHAIPMADCPCKKEYVERKQEHRVSLYAISDMDPIKITQDFSKIIEYIQTLGFKTTGVELTRW